MPDPNFPIPQILDRGNRLHAMSFPFQADAVYRISLKELSLTCSGHVNQAPSEVCESHMRRSPSRQKKVWFRCARY